MNLKMFLTLLSSFQIDSYFTKYQIGDDVDNIVELKNTRFLSSAGFECLVFAYLDYVIKIYRRAMLSSGNIDETNLKLLSSKKTERILMPDNIVYDTKTNQCAGYTMPLITNRKRLENEMIDHLLNEIALLWKDANYLAEELVLLDDLHSNNYIYNGKINIIDCGSFRDCHTFVPASLFYDNGVLDKIKGRIDLGDLPLKDVLTKVRDNNNKAINDFILTLLLDEYDYEDGILLEKNIKKYMEELGITNPADFIESTKDGDMTVNDYVVSLAKRQNMGK